MAGTKTGTGLGAVGTGLGSAVRALRGQQGRRLLSGILAGGSSMFATFTKVLHMLFLQVTGFLFLVIAVIIGSKTVQEYHLYQAGKTPASKFYVALFFGVLFTYFGLSSFWRAARKK